MQENTDNTDLKTAPELAQILKVGVHSVWRWCREDKIPFIKCGGRVRFDVPTVLEQMKRGKK